MKYYIIVTDAGTWGRGKTLKEATKNAKQHSSRIHAGTKATVGEIILTEEDWLPRVNAMGQIEYNAKDTYTEIYKGLLSKAPKDKKMTKVEAPKRTTNVEFLTQLMDFSNLGPLTQSVIMVGVEQYVGNCLAHEASLIESMKDHMVSGEEWVRQCKYIKEEFTKRRATQ